MIRGLIKKLIFLVLIAGIVYGIYWMINKDGAIEIKNKIVSIFQRNKTIDNLIKNDGEVIEDEVIVDEITVNSGIVFSGSDNSGDNSFEELLDAVMLLEDSSNTGVNDNFVPTSTTTGTTTNTTTSTTTNTTTNITINPTIKKTVPKTTVTTVKKTTTSTSNNQDILNTLFK